MLTKFKSAKYLLGFYGFILVFASFNVCKAQVKAFRYFTDEDGLPSMTVYGILQDPKGFLWIATSKGICRFDGREFKKYSLKGIKSFDTPYSFIDKEGTPWFYNLAGEILFVRNDSLQRLDIQSIKPSASIYSMYVDNPYLYISWSKTGAQSTYRYNLFNLNDKIKLDHNYIFLGQKNGDLIGYDYDRRKEYFNLYRIKNNELIFSCTITNKKHIEFIHEIDRYIPHPNNYEVIIASNYIRILDSCRNVISSKYYPEWTDEKIKYISVINEDELFVSTNKNSYLYYIISGKLIRIPYFNNYINTIFEDSNKRRWISTTDHGLILDPGNSSKVFTVQHGSLASDEIYRIHSILDYTYLGHNNGKISCFNDGSVKNYINLPGNGRVRFIDKFTKNKLLIGLDLGIHILDADFRQQILCANLQIGSIKSAIMESESGLLLCTSLGVYSSDLTALEHGKCGQFIIRRELEARALCINKFNNQFIVGTIHGLYVRREDHTWQKLLNRDIFINQLLNQSDSLLWVCSDGQGIFLFDGVSLIDSLNTELGLPSNNISSLCIIDSVRVAIGTDNGVFIFNKWSKQGFTLNKIDGVPGNEVHDIKIKNEELWVGTSKGLFRIPVNELKPNPEKPLVEIIESFAYSRTGKTQFRSMLDYDQNHLKFGIQTRSLISGNAPNIFYKLIEQDTLWSITQSRVLEFMGLGAGKYNLQIKVEHEDNLSSNIIEKPFEILQPWWKTVWFNSIMVIGISALVIGYNLIRQKKKRQLEEKERAISDQINLLKEEALQNQMNPHFMFNALNAIQSFLSSNDQFNAMNYLSKFGRLIRMIFEQSRYRRISLENEIAFLKNYLDLERLRFKDKVRIKFIIGQEVEEKASERMIPPLIIQPIVENAFKHGLMHKETIGHINITMNLVGDQLIVVVEDDGVGRSKVAQINSWKKKGVRSTGLASTKERLNILDNGRNKMGLEIIDLNGHSGEALGTKVIIKL